MEKINGKWISPIKFDSEEDRKKAMNDWRTRYRETFRWDNQFCNWLKLKGFHNSKPITPKYLKEYERQEALIEEFYKYKGVYDGLGSDHLYHGNEGKYWKIFSEEQQKIYARDRAETDKLLKKIRGSNVTVGHTPNTPNHPNRKRTYRG